MSIQKIIRLDNQPFAMIPNSVIRNPNITTGAFRLLAYLMSHSDGYELTYEQIERQTTLGRYAINEASKNLIELGYLELERPKQSNGQFGAKHWIILDPTTVGNSTMESHHMVKPTDNKENNLNKKTTNKDILAQNEFERESFETNSIEWETQHDAFDIFWVNYPRKTGKGAAKRAFWKAAANNQMAEILDGVVRMSQDPNLPETQFIPHPATWLNRDGWLDEPYPVRIKSAEELARIAKEENARRRELDLEATRQLQIQMRLSEKNRSATIPLCEHGNTIARCLKCLNKKQS
jgi:hypothetical protein